MWTHEGLHLWEAPLDLAVPHEFPTSRRAVGSRAHEPHPEATAGFGRVARYERDRLQTGSVGVARRVEVRRERQEQLGLGPRRAVQPLGKAREPGQSANRPVTDRGEAHSTSVAELYDDSGSLGSRAVGVRETRRNEC